MEENLAKSHNITNEMEEIYNNSDKIKESFEYIEILNGSDNSHRQFCELVNNSKKEILSFTKLPLAASTPDKLKKQGELINAFLNRNGESRSVYEINDSNSELIAPLERDYKAGEKCRISSNLPLKMFIFDRKALLIADASPLSLTTEIRMVLIKQQTIVNAFIALFEFFWQQSMDVKSWNAKQKK